MDICSPPQQQLDNWDRLSYSRVEKSKCQQRKLEAAFTIDRRAIVEQVGNQVKLAAADGEEDEGPA
jgi:hypothetical protein